MLKEISLVKDEGKTLQTEKIPGDLNVMPNAMPNVNANVERSLLGDKNTLTSEGAIWLKKLYRGLKEWKNMPEAVVVPTISLHCQEVDFSSFFQGYLRPSSMYPKPFIVDYNIDHVCWNITNYSFMFLILL